MADDNQQNIPEPQGTGSRRFKLTMANIFEGARHHTTYVRALEKITVDPNITFERLGAGIGLGVTLIVIALLVMTKSPGSFIYVRVWFIPILITLVILLALYVLPSRGKSLITSVAELFAFQFREKARRKASENATISSVGIKSCSDDGVITFRDGTVGRLYNVEGQTSRSILPAVADRQVQVRHQYLIQRAASTQERLITSIRPVDVRSKKTRLRELYMDAKKSDAPEREGIMSYTAMIHAIITDTMEKDETQLFQALLIRDENELQLDKAIRIFEDSCETGLYARAEAITNKAEIARCLAPMTMLSRPALEEITGQDESNIVIGEVDASVRDEIEGNDDDDNDSDDTNTADTTDVIDTVTVDDDTNNSDSHTANAQPARKQRVAQATARTSARSGQARKDK